LDDAALEAICRAAGRVQIANYNAPGQIVISGEKSALDQALTLAKARGAKRAVPLAVSIAAHSELMRVSADEYRRAVEATPLRAPKIPVIANITARPLATVAEIRAEMVEQLTMPVQWVQSVELMIAQGVTHFVELGPKDVLAGLIRRIDKNVHAVSIGDVASVMAFAGT
jgi:[acyl-carrier-protein] S-malonyltransferase